MTSARTAVRTVEVMIMATVKCRATKPDKEDCPMIQTCLARLTDRTITGCGIPLWYGGLIKREEIMVEHTVRERRTDEADY